MCHIIQDFFISKFFKHSNNLWTIYSLAEVYLIKADHHILSILSIPLLPSKPINTSDTKKYINLYQNCYQSLTMTNVNVLIS